MKNNEDILRAAAREAIKSINRLEGDPDYGNAWDAKAILEQALRETDRDIDIDDGC
jgi:hypothetical protein